MIFNNFKYNYNLYGYDFFSITTLCHVKFMDSSDFINFNYFYSFFFNNSLYLVLFWLDKIQWLK